MRSVTPMRAAKTGYIIMSVLLCVLGVVLFVWPGVSVAVIGELLGIGMIAFGAVKVAGYLSRDLFRLAFQYDLAFGVLLIALGIVTLTHPGETIGFLCVVYGILVLSDGLFKVQIAVDAKRFGIDRFAQTMVADLSTGMKQKASLAISLVHDPRVIIFDEPTNGLDVLTAKTVTDFLLELASEGKTVLLSTHIFSLVEKVCDRVGVIIDGRMVASGTLPEVAGARPLEDAFFDLYAQTVGEAS